MCDKMVLKDMSVPAGVIFEEGIKSREAYKTFIDKYNLEKLINDAYVNYKNNLIQDIHNTTVTFIGGSQAWRYLKNEPNFPVLDELEAASFNGTEFDIVFIWSTMYEDQYKEETVFIYEMFINHLISGLKKTSTLCQESDEFCLQLNLNGKKFNSIEDINDTILGSHDIEAYVFTLLITHKEQVLEKIFFKIEIMNIYSTPTDLFQIQQKKLVHPNYYLNKYGLALFSYIFPKNYGRESYNNDLVRVNVLKKLFKNQSLLDSHPKEFNFKADFSYYNYYMMIQNLYESFFKSTEIYKKHTSDQIQSTALKSVEVFKNGFDSLEERYVDILRPHLNAFIVYLSEVMKEYNPENFVGLSGGDTYRRWSDVVKKTADIDTKLYLPKKDKKVIDRLEQEFCMFCCHLKNNVFQPNAVQQYDVHINNVPYLKFMIQNTSFRLRSFSKSIFPVNLYSIDARCMYHINNKKYNYDYACLDLPVDTFKHIKSNFGFHTITEYIPFPLQWVYVGDKNLMEADIKNNDWVHYDKCRIFVPSPKLLKIDVEIMYNDRRQTINRELGNKRPKDSVRYDAITEACDFFKQSREDEDYKKTRIEQNVLDMLNICDLNTYLLLWSMNKTKTSSYYIDSFDKHTFVFKAIKMYGMFKLEKLISRTFKYKIPFSFQTVEQMYKTFVESKLDPAKKQKRISKYCRAVKKFAKRLLEESKYDEQFMSQFINCKQLLKLHDQGTGTSKSL